MKKFTLSFLSDGFSRGLHIFRSLALGLMALIGLQLTATGQSTCEPPSGVQFSIDSITPCYQALNEYSVEVWVDSFDNVDTLSLVVNFDGSTWELDNVDINSAFISSSISGGSNITGNLTSVTNSDNVVFTWDCSGDPRGSANNGAETLVATLTFSIKQFPNNNENVYSTALTYDDATYIGYCKNGSGDFTNYNGGEFIPGKITATKNNLEIELDFDTIACDSVYTDVTVTSPVGADYLYSFNGVENASFSVNNTNKAKEGPHCVYIKDNNGCLVSKEYEVIKEAAIFTFNTAVEDETCNHNGEITILPTSSTSSYTYYCVDSASLGSTTDDVNAYGAYASTDPDYELPAGVYYTNIANGCGQGTWTKDIIEAGSVFTVDGDVTDDVDVCGNPGEYTVVIVDSLTDSTSFSIKVYDADNGNTLVSDYSILDTTPTADTENDTIVIGDLEAGNYKIVVSDGTICTFDDDFEIEKGAAIDFSYRYSDVACSDTSGMFWITSVDGDSVKNMTSAEAEAYGVILIGTYVDENGYNITTFDTISYVADTIKSLMPGIYDAYLYVTGTDPKYDCQYEKEDIVLFDRGTILFTVKDSIFDCGSSAVIWVPEIDRNCEQCTEDAVYEVKVYDEAGDEVAATPDWISVDKLDEFSDDFYVDMPVYGDTATYRVEIKDTVNDEGCLAFQYVELIRTDSFYCIVDSVYTPSCECRNDGSVKITMVNGTAPYKYSINGSEWTDGYAFNLKENKDYEIRVQDANGCEWLDTVTEPNLNPFSIVASVSQATCPGKSAYVDVDTLSTTHWQAGFEYYRTQTKIDLSDGNCTDADEVRDNTTQFDPGTTGTGFPEGSGLWYIYAIDKYGCVAGDEVSIDNVDSMEVTITLDSAQCYGSWTAGLKISIEENTGNPDTVFYYRWSNSYDVLANDPDGERHEWRPFDYDDVNDLPLYEESAQMTSGTYWIEVKDACTYYFEKVTIGGWDKLVVEADRVQHSDCYAADNGIIEVISTIGGAVGNVADAKYTYSLLKDITTTAAQSGVYDTYLTYDEVTATTFTGLEPGYYVVLVNDGYCNPDTSDVIIVTEPCEITFDTKITHVSCADAEDGTVTIYMDGGIAGTHYYWDITGDYCSVKLGDEAHYYVTVNNLTSGSSATRTVDNDVDTLIFRTDGGEIELKVTDENKACYATDTIDVFEPLPWTFEKIVKLPEDCDTTGSISVVVHGGFTDATMFSQFSGTYLPHDSIPISVAFENGGDTTFCNMGSTAFVGDTILVSDSVNFGETYNVFAFNIPEVVGVDTLLGGPFFYQLTNGQCWGVDTVTMPSFDPFDVEFSTECAKCYGEDNGSIIISSITGGFSGKYRLQFVPEDSTYADEPADASVWYPNDNTWITDVDSLNPFVYSELGAGNYRLYLIDGLGYTVEKCCNPWAFNICEPEELVIDSVVRIKNNGCEGETTGAFQIYASGGTPDYKYYYSRQPLSALDTFTFPGVPDKSLFQDTAVFDSMASGAYVGWVMDANECIVGCDLDEQGLPKIGQRVVIYDGETVVYDSVTVAGAGCNYEPVTVTYYNVNGAADDILTLTLVGTAEYNDSTSIDTTLVYNTAYSSEYVDYTFENIPIGEFKTYLTTEVSCPAEDLLEIEPGDFEVAYTLHDGGVCYGDSKLYFTIEATGGTAPYLYAVEASDGTVLREPSTIADQNYNSLDAEDYTEDLIVVAYDSKGCRATNVISLSELKPVSVEIANITCYSDTLGSVRVTADGTEGRWYSASWDEFEGDTQVASGTSDTFSTSIDLLQLFHYDPEGTDDVHYELTVYDNMGCQSGIDTITIHTVNDPLEINNYVQTENGCTTDIAFDIDGGTRPYEVYVNDELQIENDGSSTVGFALGGGDYTIKVVDAHTRCTYEKEITVDYSIVDYDTVKTYTDEAVEYVYNSDADTVTLAGVDSSYTFYYTTAASCSAMLNVDVITRDRTAPELDTVSPTDTVTNVTPDFVIEFLDDVTYNADADTTFYLTVVPVNSADAGSLKLEITPEMVSGNKITVGGYSSDLDKYTTYVVSVDSGVVVGDGLAWDGVVTNWTFTTGDFATGNNPDVNAIEFKVYPNPFDNEINIENYDSIDRVIVSNIAGQRVMDIVSPEQVIKTGNLSSGVYVVTLISNNKIVKSERVVKR